MLKDLSITNIITDLERGQFLPRELEQRLIGSQDTADAWQIVNLIYFICDAQRFSPQDDSFEKWNANDLANIAKELLRRRLEDLLRNPNGAGIEQSTLLQTVDSSQSQEITNLLQGEKPLGLHADLKKILDSREQSRQL
ncbi:MAG: hypothetical protein ABI425_03615 [Patescibacteria group bacterium]